MSPSDSPRAGHTSVRSPRKVREKLKVALVSVDADKGTISKLLSSSKLGNVVVPLYARGTVTDEFYDLGLI